MPRRDGTGPMGLGSRAGRGIGDCKDLPMPEDSRFGLGRRMGFGFGNGQGRGRRRGCFSGWGRLGNNAVSQVMDTNFEKHALEAQAQALQSELDLIKQRLSEIDTENETK